ncbi:MAG: hypothetical protein R3E88_16195 [Myxococcota bacterium]
MTRRPRRCSRATRSLGIATLAALLAATAARATVKVYDATPPAGTAGDRLLFVESLCTPIDITPGVLAGGAVVDDAGSGTVTLDALSIEQDVSFDVDTTSVFGPGSFVFATSTRTDAPSPGQTGGGSTAPGGSVAWGILAGWTTTGISHCISSPAGVCNSNGFLHGTTVPSEGTSPTFDLGTWVFDAGGDYQAISAYVQQTANGGESNVQWLLRGSYVGGSVPALPALGMGTLAAATAAAALRALRPVRSRGAPTRRRERAPERRR